MWNTKLGMRLMQDGMFLEYACTVFSSRGKYDESTRDGAEA